MADPQTTLGISEEQFLANIINMTTGWRSFHGLPDQEATLRAIQKACEARRNTINYRIYEKEGMPG